MTNTFLPLHFIFPSTTSLCRSVISYRYRYRYTEIQNIDIHIESNCILFCSTTCYFCTSSTFAFQYIYINAYCFKKLCGIPSQQCIIIYSVSIQRHLGCCHITTMLQRTPLNSGLSLLAPAFPQDKFLAITESKGMHGYFTL